MIKSRLEDITRVIARSCEDLKRSPEEVCLVCVTKFADALDIETAISCGIEHIAENRVQLAEQKFAKIQNIEKVTKHFIGHLQTNKVKQTLTLFDIIQSVDSIKLIDEINKQAQILNITADIFLQVNIACEKKKYGFSQGDIFNALDYIESCSNINVSGLMAMAPFVDNADRVRSCFSTMNKIFNETVEKYNSFKNINLKYLSMGMSSDYTMAIVEGANMIRIGSLIFNQ